MTKIDIRGLDRAELLAALVMAVAPHRMGVLSDDGRVFTVADAQQWIDAGWQHDDEVGQPVPQYLGGRRRPLFFDYVKGRPLKCNLGGDTLNPDLYDDYHGAGAAERVVAALRARLAAEGRR